MLTTETLLLIFRKKIKSGVRRKLVFYLKLVLKKRKEKRRAEVTFTSLTSGNLQLHMYEFVLVFLSLLRCSRWS